MIVNGHVRRADTLGPTGTLGDSRAIDRIPGADHDLERPRVARRVSHEHSTWSFAFVLSLEGRLLDDRPGSVVRPPEADLTAAVESPGSHQAAVLAEELPVAMHLAVQVRSAESD